MAAGRDCGERSEPFGLAIRGSGVHEDWGKKIGGVSPVIAFLYVRLANSVRAGSGQGERLRGGIETFWYAMSR